MRHESWRDRAACLDQDPDLFVEVDPGDRPVEALRVCRRCPVRVECLDYALALPELEDAGVFGGTTEKARRDIRRGREDRRGAMRRGDEASRRRTTVERLREDEPWLAVVR